MARESPQLRTLRCTALGDNGKWSVRDVDAVFEACPSLELFECDVGVKIDSRCVLFILIIVWAIKLMTSCLVYRFQIRRGRATPSGTGYARFH